MVKKTISVLLILITLCIWISSCKRTTPIKEGYETATESLEAATESLSWKAFQPTLYNVLPDIHSFSGEGCSAFENYYLPVKAVSININETEEALSSDDPRLIRLLNFIMNSIEEKSAGMTFGYLTEEDTNLYYESFPSYVRIVFHNPEDSNINGIMHLHEMIIFADRYLLIGSFEDGEPCVEEHFPYMQTLEECAASAGFGQNEEIGQALPYEDPTAPWIDMLQYSGLTDS